MNSTPTDISDPVTVPSPIRLLITAAATAAWYDTVDEATRHAVATRWTEMIGDWVARLGVRLITTFDDDLLLAGDPRPFGRWSIYLVFEVDSLEDAVAMVDGIRHGEIRLHRYFTLAGTIGRSFWPGEKHESQGSIKRQRGLEE